MLFNQPNRVAVPESHASLLHARTKRWISSIAVFVLISAATAVMMLCPCDSVGIRDHYAISLVAIAFLLGIAAAYLIYRRMRNDSGITGFLRAVIAIAFVAFAVYLELFAAMEVVSWLARPH
jgi:peptidoglycan/LPS O-acetylase OafA/YrhL